MADPAAVKDHAVAQQRPLSAFDEVPHRMLHLDRIGFCGPPPATYQPAKMGINGDTRDAEGVAQNHIGGFSPDPGQGHQLGQRAGNVTTEPSDKFTPEADQRIGFVSIKPGRPDEFLKFGAVCLRVVASGAVLREQCRGGQVDPLIGALGRQDRRDRQLKRIGEVQFAIDVGEGARQRPVHPAGPSDQAEMSFPIPLRGPCP